MQHRHDIVPLTACTGVSTSSLAPHLTAVATTYFNIILHSTKYIHLPLLLATLENYLGDVGTWPSYIITYLFAKVVEELTTFFAGNGVPKTCAATILHEVFLVALFRHRPTSLHVL